MNKKERWFVAGILFSIIVMAVFDLATDSREGVALWHLGIEGLVVCAAVFGIYLILQGAATLRHSLKHEKNNAEKLRIESEKWRLQSKKYIDGLSQAIDSQLAEWNLSASEKEVAFLLLKGLSLKEIADVRKTSEKTARTQSIAVYSKAGLSGRSELAAFFLEDLFLPLDDKSCGRISG